MRTGTLGVNLTGLLPIIRKYLYTHSDVFLRELIANSVDACQKFKSIALQENLPSDPSELKVEILVYPAKRQLVIKDNGIGMTAEEVEQFLSVIAASSAQAFAEQYKETDIIGFFGMGFYSAFMVAQRVEVLTQSYRADAPAARWTSDGSEAYTLEEAQRPEGRGTTITLHLSPEYDEYAQIWKVRQIAEKYARFLSIPILVEGSAINQKPLWREQPSSLTEADYRKFYQLLYPTQPPPAFSVHLNIDYPITLQGILYFPTLRPDVAVERSSLALYVRGMFITEQLSEILPEYLQILQGVIESPDIPLNVSRSQLQVDPTVRKISQYISRKVLDRLAELLREERPRYEELWPHVGPFVKYGMVREETFAKRAQELALVQTIDKRFFTLPEYQAQLTLAKDPKGIALAFYVNEPARQGLLASLLEKKGHPVILADTVIDPYWLSYLEREGKVRFVRVDAPEAAQWLRDADEGPSLTLEEEKTIREALERLTGLAVEKQNLGPTSPAAMLVRDESQRRYAEALLQTTSPPPPRLVWNPQHPIYRRYLLTQDIRWLEQAWDWARLLSGELQAQDLERFLQRDWQLLSSA